MSQSANLDIVRAIYASFGLEGMAEANRDVLSAWDDVSLQAKEYRELDDERVLVRFVQHGQGKSSGLDLAQVPAEAAHLFHLRNGKVRTLVVYWGADSALADLGLTPDTGT